MTTLIQVAALLLRLHSAGYVVDAIESGWAEVDDCDGVYEVPASMLPACAHVGTFVAGGVCEEPWGATNQPTVSR